MLFFKDLFLLVRNLDYFCILHRKFIKFEIFWIIRISFNLEQKHNITTNKVPIHHFWSFWSFQIMKSRFFPRTTNYLKPEKRVWRLVMLLNKILLSGRSLLLWKNLNNQSSALNYNDRHVEKKFRLELLWISLLRENRKRSMSGRYQPHQRDRVSDDLWWSLQKKKQQLTWRPSVQSLACSRYCVGEYSPIQGKWNGKDFGFCFTKSKVNRNCLLLAKNGNRAVYILWTLIFYSYKLLYGQVLKAWQFSIRISYLCYRSKYRNAVLNGGTSFRCFKISKECEFVPLNIHI